jgi:hypothetical protein
MSIKLFIPAIIALFFGFGLGCIPTLNEHLHWNLYYVVPVSGLLFGLLAGWGQFQICYRLNTKVGGWEIAMLTAAALFGYVAMDYGIYTVSTITASGVEGLKDGVYRIKDLMTFVDYMKWNLSGSTLSSRYGSDPVKIGATATTISYIADLVGVLIADLVILCFTPQLFPYCDRCSRFSRRVQRLELYIIDVENLASTVLSEIKDLIGKGIPENVLSRCEQLAEQYHVKKGNVKITIDHRACPQCQGISLVGTVHHLVNRDWHEESKLRFFMNPQPQTAQIQPGV